jgi:hypothetical protein
VADLTDEELLDELAAAEDPDEVIRLRALATQRGLRAAAFEIPSQERRRIAEEQGGWQR